MTYPVTNQSFPETELYPWEDPAYGQCNTSNTSDASDWPDLSNTSAPESPVDKYAPVAPQAAPQTSVASTAVFDEPPVCEGPADEAEPIVAYAGTMQVRVQDVDPGYSAGDIIAGAVLTIGGVAVVVLAAPAEITAGGVFTVAALGSLLVGGSGCNNTKPSVDASTDTAADTDVDTQDTDDTDVIVAPDYSNVDIDGDLYLDESSLTADQLAQYHSQGFIENAYGNVVSLSGDCNDTLAYVNPGPNAFQRVNGIDTNCDGTTAPNLASDAVMFFGEAASDGAGNGAIALGDVDGDGYDDVLVGAAGKIIRDNSGAVYVQYGSPAFFAARGSSSLSNADVRIVASMPAEGFGASVIAYDLDGTADGNNTKDLIVGAGGYNNSVAHDWFGLGNGTNSGAIMIFNGGSIASGSDRRAAAIIVGAADELIGGTTYTFKADVNGDSLGEIVTTVGSGDDKIDFIPARPYSGTVLKDSVRTLRFSDNLNLISDWAKHVAIGDVDGDGYGDILLGDTVGYRIDGRGQAILIYGSPTLPPIINLSDLTPASGIEYRTFTGNSPMARAGSAVAIQDIDGDGIPDIVIGAKADETGGAGSPAGGVTYVIYGQDFEDARAGLGALDLTLNGSNVILGSDVELLNGKRIFSTTPNGTMPAALTAASDTNGDGIYDLLMASNTFGANGAAFYLSGQTLATTPGPAVDIATAQQITDGSTIDLGSTVAGGGDVDGDGNQDVLVNDVPALSGSGAVYILSGGATH
ncbi:putative metal-binding motif-containing protein [bacterium]|nr:putative metal-binding motif-containing protein [bacterium]